MLKNLAKEGKKMAKFCTKCGVTLANGGEICVSCEAEQKSTDSSTKNEKVQLPQKKKSLFMKFGIVIAVLIVTAGISGHFVMKSKMTSEEVVNPIVDALIDSDEKSFFNHVKVNKDVRFNPQSYIEYIKEQDMASFSRKLLEKANKVQKDGNSIVVKHEDGSDLFQIEQKMYLYIYPIVQISAISEDVVIANELDDITIELDEKEYALEPGKKSIGKFLPGNYSINALMEKKSFHNSGEWTVQLGSENKQLELTENGSHLSLNGMDPTVSLLTATNSIENGGLLATKDKTLAKKFVVEADAVFTMELQTGKDMINVFVVPNNATKEVIEFESFIGNKGETTYQGDFDFYLAEKDSEITVRQDQLEFEEWWINTDTTRFDIFSVKEQSFLKLALPETSIDYSMMIWAMKNGELNQISLDTEDRGVSTSKVKVITDEYIQTYSYDRDFDIGHTFMTFKWNEEDFTFDNVYDRHIESDMSYDLWSTGSDIVESWHEIDDYYDLFPNLEFTKETAKLAEKGLFANAPYKLGTPISEILNDIPQYSTEAYHHGGRFHTFAGGYSYFDDEATGITNNIHISGTRLKTDLSELESIFGKPSDSGFDEMQELDYTTYTFGNYEVLIFSNDNEPFDLFFSERL